MRDVILNTAIRHFALISSIFGQDQTERIISRSVEYIKTFCSDNNIKEYIRLFTDSFADFSDDYNLFEIPELAYHSYNTSFDKIYSDIVIQLRFKDRLLLTLLVIDFYNEVFSEDIGELKILEITANRFGFSNEEFKKFLHFISLNDTSFLSAQDDILIFKPRSERTDDLEGTWIEQNKPDDLKNINEIEISQLKCKLYILYFERFKSFILKCSSPENLEIDGRNLRYSKFKILEPGTEIRYENQMLLNYSGIKTSFVKGRMSTDLSLVANGICFKENNRNKTLRNFFTYEDTGKLIGILGKEGVGKSTLLELIAGRIKPDEGKIFVNGYNLNTNKYILRNIIGYVPEEDMLFNELTVTENLDLTARLFFSNLPAKERELKVNRILETLDLFEVRNKVVGSELDKNIQPGQRRLLNIALELIREPKILLVDNSVYGLGSSESSKILKVLNDYTFDGNLVITTLTQTSSQSFKLFDKLWILDESGYPVYNGNASEAPSYLKSQLGITGFSDHFAENTPEYILELLDFRNADLSGKSGRRKITPAEWNRIFLSQIDKKTFSEDPLKIPIPANYIHTPNLETQFKIFSLRNFKVKFSNSQKLFVSILAGPFIAFILSIILKKSTNGNYSFYLNSNIPLYFFSSSVISILLGLFISSKEILTEKNIHSKELYLEFSGFSYINSKIAYLFSIGAFQTFLYVLTGNGILEIRGMLISHWLILYSSCCYGIMIGLIFSAVHTNLNTLYEKTIPLFIALQILLGGGLVTYKNLNLNKGPYVPVIGDLMVSKWSYEALMVDQFINNEYNKHIYGYEKNISNSKYISTTLIPELQKTVDLIPESNVFNDSLSLSINKIKAGIQFCYSDNEVFQFEYLDRLNEIDFSEKILSETKDYLTYLDLYFYNKYENSIVSGNERLNFLKDSLGTENMLKFRQKNHNKKIEEIVLNKDEPVSWKVFHNKIFQISDPVYQNPQSDLGRSYLFLPQKKFRGQVVETLWFNITVIWLYSLLLYLILITDLSQLETRIVSIKFKSYKK